MQVRSQFKEHKQLIASISAEMTSIEKIVKDEDPTGSAETGKNKRTSICMMSKAVQERFVTNEIHEIVKAGLDYEDVVSTHDALVEVPDDLVANLSNSCVEVASFISDKVRPTPKPRPGCWGARRLLSVVTFRRMTGARIDRVSSQVDHLAIKRLVQRRADDPPLLNEDISAIKKEMVDEFIGKLLKQANTVRPPTAGTICQQARDRYFVKVNTVLEMAMSKHDQVVVPGLSLHARTSIPTCVACDRPLPTKKRIGELVRESESVIANAKLDPSPRPPRPKSSEGRTKVGQPSSGERARPRTSGSAMPAPSGQGAYVYRGGFKMPRRDNLGGAQSLPKLGDASHGPPVQDPAKLGMSLWGGDNSQLEDDFDDNTEE